MRDSTTVPGEGETSTAADPTGISDTPAATQGDQPATVSNSIFPEAPYGAWPSPISASEVARGRIRISFPIVSGEDMWWQEGRPEEGGRITIVHRGADGKTQVLLPAPWNARTRVHEYGGLSYLPVPGSAGPGSAGPAGARGIVFANFADQRLYLAGPGSSGGPAPRPLTPDPAGSAGSAVPGEAAGLRFADFALAPDGTEVWCVQELHAGGKVTRSIVAVPLDGSAAANPDAIRQLAAGSDFFAFPTPSPDGTRLAWISWNHPHMPWDGTELRVAAISNGVAGPGRLVKGGLRESVMAPQWRDNTSLYVATDWTGWWNIYQVGLTGEPPQALFPVEEEFAGPLWQLGARPFAILGDGKLAVLHGRGGMRLGILDPETSELTDPDIPFSEFYPGLSADGAVIAAVAGGPRKALSIISADTATSKVTVLRSELTELPDERYLPVPHQVELEGPFGRIVHALVYEPSNPVVRAPAGERPPYVVWIHGGPTACSVGLLDMEKAYFTSRGIGIVDVNYGGSTGYGRLYRERLRRQWGVVDVEDAKAAALSLAAAGQADRARLAIRGGSAGGWTALAAVTTGAQKQKDAVFAAATSYYGVSDLSGFAASTHDFESRYLDGLIGPLPGFEAIYIERAPVGHVTSATCPVLLLQGLDDPVVPPQQSESIATDLAAHGIRYAYIAFEGESHGFRKADSVITSLEAELSFYGQILGFTPPGIPAVALTGRDARSAR
jgi:dipeptidyl aminopeptidase/acylaminoacyl peptidase